LNPAEVTDIVRDRSNVVPFLF